MTAGPDDHGHRYEVHHTTELDTATTVFAPLLAADPVRANVVLALLDQLRRRDADSRFWLLDARPGRSATEPTDPGGDRWVLAVHSHPDQPLALVAGDHTDLVAPLAEAVATTLAAVGIELETVAGEIRLSAEFAARWASFTRRRATVDIVQRLYTLDVEDLIEPPPPTDPPGELRPATVNHLPLLTPWAVGFQHDTFGHRDVDVAALADHLLWKIEEGEVWIWFDSEPSAMVAATTPVAGVARIQHVYTPPENRGRGLAAACVAELVTDRAAAGVERCVLFTDLANPVSNRIYQRLGFEPVLEAANFSLSADER